MDHGRAVSLALHEMNPGYGRQVLQIVHAEAQWTIHQAVDREAMLLRIDVGEMGRVVLNEMEPGRCDDPRIILKRSVVGDVIDAHSHPAARGHTALRRPVVEDVLLFGFYFRLGCLALRGPFSGCARTYAHTCQRSSLLHEPPTARSIGIHDSLR